MKRETTKTTSRNILPGVTTLLLLVSGMAMSQVPVDENGAPLNSLDSEIVDSEMATDGGALAGTSELSATELEELAGPIALYPDDLLAIVLPASTYPLEIVQAARFLTQLETDNSLQPDDAWDESVTALLNYPEVVRMMDDDIDWTWRLGEAVIAQQEQLIAAIEAFRDRAYAAGNLKSDEYQKVSNDEGIIEIVPVDEEIIYVPYYEPEEMVVYQPRQVYYYYPQAYPVYYYPYPVGHRFSSGYFWGVTTAFSIGWNNHYLNVYHPSYWGHPYYGRSYYSHYYRSPSISVYNNWYVNNSYRRSTYRQRDGDHWRPRHRSGARPQDQRVRNRHYPSQDRNLSRDGSRAQVRNNGRVELGLRDRNSVGTHANRTTGNRSTATSASINTRTNRSSEPRGNRNDRGITDRTNQQRQRQVGVDNPNRTRLQGTENNSANTGARSSSDGAAIRFRNRQNADTVRAATNTRRQTSSNARAQRQVTANSAAARSAANQQANNRRRATSANVATRRAAPERAVVQPQRSQANSNRAPATTRAPAATRDRAPARQQVQRAANRGNSGAEKGRKQSSSRATNRQKKRKN